MTSIWRKILTCTLLTTLTLACGNSEKKGDSTVEGWRWSVKLIRADVEDTWIEVQGAQEWWFFKSGVFRQIGSDYVEPQFYSSIQACNGAATGTFTKGEEKDGLLEVTLKYEGIEAVSGLCRMTDRLVYLTLQPSGSLDLLDNKRVQRSERVEEIR